MQINISRNWELRMGMTNDFELFQAGGAYLSFGVNKTNIADQAEWWIDQIYHTGIKGFQGISNQAWEKFSEFYIFQMITV